MGAAESEVETAAREVLAKVADILEPVGFQEEAELPAQILAEFVMDSRKKDKLLCSQLQVVDFLQNFLVQEGTAQDQNPLASEDTSRQKALEAKEQWKELKATYQEHVEKQMAMEKLRIAQKQWQLEQEKHLQNLAEASSEVRERQTGAQQELQRLYQELGTLKQQAGQEKDKRQRHQTFLQLLYTLQGKQLFNEAEAEIPQELDLPKDKLQQVTQPQEQNTQDTMGREADNPQPVGDAGLPWLPGRQQHKEES
uniref:ZW10 interacting kinetochore protein n=1 Tax=Bos mutus grunniens TaxID=30521 RepID=A0A8B9WJK7_BOSMU